VVERVGIQNHECDAPFEDILVYQLFRNLVKPSDSTRPRMTYVDLDPLLLGQCLELVHKDSLRHTVRVREFVCIQILLLMVFDVTKSVCNISKNFPWW
jgi:hypothetical protein